MLFLCIFLEKERIQLFIHFPIIYTEWCIIEEVCHQIFLSSILQEIFSLFCFWFFPLLHQVLSKVFDSRGKMKQILLAYGLPKEMFTTVMMLYKNTKTIFHSPKSDTIFFNIVTWVFQGDTLEPYMFIICLDYVLMNVNRSW